MSQLVLDDTAKGHELVQQPLYRLSLESRTHDELELSRAPNPRRVLYRISSIRRRPRIDAAGIASISEIVAALE